MKLPRNSIFPTGLCQKIQIKFTARGLWTRTLTDDQWIVILGRFDMLGIGYRTSLTGCLKTKLDSTIVIKSSTISSTSLTGPENHRTSLRFQPFNRKVFWIRNEARWFSYPVSEVLYKVYLHLNFHKIRDLNLKPMLLIFQL
jgi:hypothetical protein